MLDDVHLHSVKELARLLAYDGAKFKVRADLGKALIFQKLTAQRDLGEWNTEPYIEAMTNTYLHAPYALRLWQIKPSIVLSKLLAAIVGIFLLPQRAVRALTRRVGARHSSKSLML